MKPSPEAALIILIVLAGGYAIAGTALLHVLDFFGVHGVQFPCYVGRGC